MAGAWAFSSCRGFVGYAGAAGERGNVESGGGVGAGEPWGRQGDLVNQPCALAPPVLDVSVPALPLLAVRQRFSARPRGSIFVTGFLSNPVSPEKDFLEI